VVVRLCEYQDRRGLRCRGAKSWPAKIGPVAHRHIGGESQRRSRSFLHHLRGPARRWADRAAETGTYIYADRPAGRHQLLATEAFFPGDSKQELKTEPGRTYFLLARTSARHDAVTGMSVMGGIAGAVVGSVATAGSENAGPVDFVPLDEAAARTVMAELQLAE
jgi:hypothetical protein